MLILIPCPKKPNNKDIVYIWNRNKRTQMARITYEQIKQSEEINTYIKRADIALKAMGYTEHSFAHVTKVASTASRLLLDLGYDERTAELARIAGYMHDIAM